MRRNIKKVMLVYPPVTRPPDFSSKIVRVSSFFPLGIAYLAASLEKAGRYQLRIMDALIDGYTNKGTILEDGGKIRYGLTDEEIAKRIESFAPDALLVSCLFSAIQWDMNNVCRIAKQVDPAIITIVGGAHPGAMPIEVLKQYGAIDFVGIGEGEVTIVELLKTLEDEGDLAKLDGIAYREHGVPKCLPKTRYIENLDSLPFPARHLFDMKKYLSNASAHSTFRQTPFTQMITSRGCPYKCAFCALGNHWGSKQRMRSAENVLDEIECLVKTYGIKEIHFEDDNLTANKERAIAIFDGMIERGFGISWNVPSGMAVSTLSEELLVKMKASGCYSVSLAIESGNQDVLKHLMNKPVNLKGLPGLVRKIREVGMDARGFFILGYPGETKETIKQTIDFARNLELDWAYFFIASPLPNTKMYKTCIEKGYIKEEDFDPVKSFYQSIIRTPEFTPKYLAEVREEAIIDVNFRNNPNLLKYDINKAILSFEEVVNRYPHFDFANFYLGEAYLKKGDRDKAVDSYNKTLAANCSHKEALEKLKELETVRRKKT
jgi:anaerobic magnesium-protoporphyrin IX monomethyl ester cyclase